MPKYLVEASYTVDGLKGLLKDGGTKRKAVVENLVKGLGGSVEALYYAFGADDVIVIVDLPDDTTATALSLAVGATGSVSLRTRVLLSPETIDEAVKKTVDYIAPGQ